MLRCSFLAMQNFSCKLESLYFFWDLEFLTGFFLCSLLQSTANNSDFYEDFLCLARFSRAFPYIFFWFWQIGIFQVPHIFVSLRDFLSIARFFLVLNGFRLLEVIFLACEFSRSLERYFVVFFLGEIFSDFVESSYKTLFGLCNWFSESFEFSFSHFSVLHRVFDLALRYIFWMLLFLSLVKFISVRRILFSSEI